MKKNITINMQGRLYAIDEDAYDLLKQYEDSLRNYFAAREGGHEIVDDIEARIAELFDEVLAQGKAAIDIADVQTIVKRMGNPSEMDEVGNGGDEQHNSTENCNDGESSVFCRLKHILSRPGRRLYRDTTGRQVAGVLAGLAHYYGGDVTWWRIAVLSAAILCPFVCNMPEVPIWMIVAYCILGITMPPASTPEDRLRMNGRDVNPQNLADEVTSANNAPQPQPQPQRGGCLSVLGEIVVFGLKMLVFLTAAAAIMACIGLLVLLLLLLFIPAMPLFSDNGISFPWASHPWVGTIGVASFVLFIVLAVYGLISMWRSHDGLQNLSSGHRLALAVLLIAALTGAMTCGSIIISDLSQQNDRNGHQRNEQYIKDNTHNGFFISPEDWRYLQDNGWTLVQGDHCNDCYTNCGEYYTGNEARRYLDCYNIDGEQLYRVEHTDSCLTAGTYTLTAVARTDGPGACIYAVSDGKTYTAEIPAEGNTGGNLWQEAAMATVHVDGDTAVMASNKRLLQIAKANNGNGYGWSTVTISGIKCRGGRISFGVTTVPQITKDHFGGTYFSATDFHLAKGQ